MMFALAARPARQSLPFMDPSTVSCDAVAACTYPQASGCVALGVSEECSTRVYVTVLTIWEAFNNVQSLVVLFIPLRTENSIPRQILPASSDFAYQSRAPRFR